MKRVYEHPNRKLLGVVKIEGRDQSEVLWDNGQLRVCNNDNLRDAPQSPFEKWKQARSKNGKPKGKPASGRGRVGTGH